MRTHVALLKGINVGGRNMVKMADLRQMFSDIGMSAPETLLQSGNVVFGCSGKNSSELEPILEAEASKRLSLDVRFFVRSAEELDGVISKKPFADESQADPSHLLVHFLSVMPLAYDIERVQANIAGPERIAAGIKHLYVVYPNGIGASTIARTPGWNRLTSDGTARNWNTVLKLADLVRA